MTTMVYALCGNLVSVNALVFCASRVGCKLSGLFDLALWGAWQFEAAAFW